MSVNFHSAIHLTLGGQNFLSNDPETVEMTGKEEGKGGREKKRQEEREGKSGKGREKEEKQKKK